MNMRKGCQSLTRCCPLPMLACIALAACFVPVAAAADEPLWIFPPQPPPRVNLVQGLWHEHYGLHAALALVGGAMITESWDSAGTGFGWPGPGDQGGGSVRHFDGSPAGLQRQHVLVVANVNARNFHGAQQTIVDYVQAGGAVLFLGGRWALGRAYRDSPLATICPVDFPGRGRWQGSDLQFSPNGVPVAPGDDAIGDGFGALSWDEEPLLYWYHTVKPKDGSKILLTVDGKPALVAGAAGKGRVAVFTGTVMGNPEPGRMPLWEWDGWPRILAATIQWLAEAPAAGAREPDAARQAALLAAVDEAAVELGLGMALEDETEQTEATPPGLMQFAAASHTSPSVEFLLPLVASLEDDIPPKLVEKLDRNVFTLVTPTGGETARQLIASGQPYKTALGLRVLGASRTEGAVETLEAFLTSGEVARRTESRSAAALGGRQEWMQTEMVDSIEAERRCQAIRLAALAGLGHLGSTEAGDVLAQARKDLRTGRLDPARFEDQLSNDNLLYQQALVSALRCGDTTVASELTDTLMEIVYLIARARTEANKPDDRLERLHRAIGWHLVWQRDLYRHINAAPATVLPALAAAVAEQTDRRAVVIALALFAGRQLPDDARDALRKSPQEAIRLLAR